MNKRIFDKTVAQYKMHIDKKLKIRFVMLDTIIQVIAELDDVSLDYYIEPDVDLLSNTMITLTNQIKSDTLHNYKPYITLITEYNKPPVVRTPRMGRR